MSGPNPNPGEARQPESRQDQEHRPGDEIQKHVAEGIVQSDHRIEVIMWPVPSPAPSIERIEDGAVDPAGQLEPKIDEEQRELHDADRDDRLEVVSAHDQYQRNADHQRHLEEREHHGQCLAHHVHGGECCQSPNGHSHVACRARHDVRQGLVDLATVVCIDRALVEFLLTRRGDRANHRIVHLAAAQESSPACKPSEKAGVYLAQKPCPQAVVAIGPPLPAVRVAAARHMRKPCIAVAVVGPVLARSAGAIAVVVASRVREEARADR